MNEIRIKWNQIYTKGITLSTKITKINIILFADEQGIITDSVNILQRGEFTVKKKF